MNDLFLPSIALFKNEISFWNREVFGNIFVKKRKLLARLVGIQASPNYPTSSFLQTLEVDLSQELNRLLQLEHDLWQLKSRVNWLNNGDANTKFFHISVLNRRRKNRILALRDQGGNWIEGRDNLEFHIINFFKNLFTMDLIACPQQGLYAPSRFVPPAVHVLLEQPLTRGEISSALNSFKPF